MFTDKNTTARRLIKSFRTIFMDIGGAPVKIFADNSPFKAAELQVFLRDWGGGGGVRIILSVLSPIQRQSGSGRQIHEQTSHRLQDRWPTRSG